MTKKSLTCISCPLGCSLTVTISDGNLEVSGNSCPKGREYAANELLSPKRILTTTIAVLDGQISVVSVKSSAPIPKEKIFDCLKKLKDKTLTAPVQSGQIIIEDILGTGVDIVATKTVAKKI